MTNKEAIEFAECLKNNWTISFDDLEPFCDMAIEALERTVAHIQDFVQYQVDWLTEHNDLELELELEDLVIRFLQDTADCYDKEYLTSAEQKGKDER